MADESFVYVNRGPLQNGNGYTVDLVKNGWQRVITYTGYVDPKNENCIVLYPKSIGEGRADKHYYEKHKVCVFDSNYKLAY